MGDLQLPFRSRTASTSSMVSYHDLNDQPPRSRFGSDSSRSSTRETTDNFSSGLVEPPVYGLNNVSLLTNWHNFENGQLSLQVLLPNGILVDLTVSDGGTVHDLKQLVLNKTYNNSDKYPLSGLLTNDPSFYRITYISQDGTKADVKDEDSTLQDLHMRMPFIRMEKIKGNPKSNETEKEIGTLIGKNLSSFRDLQCAEINEFRWKMKVFATDVARRRKLSLNKNWQNILRYQYPPMIVPDQDHVSPLLMNMLKIKEDKIAITIRWDTKEMFKEITTQTTPLSLLDAIGKELGLTGKYTEEGCLKILGKEEYLVDEIPLINCSSIRENFLQEKPSVLLWKPRPSINIIQETPNSAYAKISEEIQKNGAKGRLGKNGRKKSVLVEENEDYINSIDLHQKLPIEISSAHIKASLMNGNQKPKNVYLYVGMFHGSKSLCPELKLSLTYSKEDLKRCGRNTDFSYELNLCKQMEISISSIPRMARLCFGLSMGLGKQKKDIPIAWVNTSLFDYKQKLKKRIALHFWPNEYGQYPTHGMLNPLKTSQQNKNFKEAASVIITIGSSMLFGKNVVFPTEERNSAEFAYEPVYFAERNFENKSSVGRGRKMTRRYSEELKKIAKRDRLHGMSEQEKMLIISLKEECRVDYPSILPRVIDCVSYTNYDEVMDLHTLLKKWPLIPLESAIQLLDYGYPDEHVRNYAVKCLGQVKDEKLEMYLVQLLQGIKHENYFHCNLVEFLLNRALNNQRLGHHFFWLLRSEIKNEFDNVKFGLILEAYLLASPEHMPILEQQKFFLVKVKSIDETLSLHENNNASFSFERRKSIFKSSLKKTFSTSLIEDGFISPMDPTLRCHGIKFEECHVMKSKKKPQKLVFENYDTKFAADAKIKDITLMFKAGDDLRQDMLILQLIQVMDNIWKQNGLDLRMTTYKCVPTLSDQGLIEIVNDAETICSIQMKESAKNKTGGFAMMAKATAAFKRELIFRWLERHHPDQESLELALEEFRLSCAGYSVAMYILGIGDRHNDNIMLQKSGKLFHIDFGHVMGNFKSKFGLKRERVPILLPSEFVHVISQGKEENFDMFRAKCVEAYRILRPHGNLLISLLAMMLSTGLPELNCEQDLDYVRNALQLDDSISEEKAEQHFNKELDVSLQKAWTVSMNWWTHMQMQ